MPWHLNRLGDDEAGAVVDDLDFDSTIDHLRRDQHSSCVGMLLDVGQRLCDVFDDDRLDRDRHPGR